MLFADGSRLWENNALEKQKSEVDKEGEHKSKDLTRGCFNTNKHKTIKVKMDFFNTNYLSSPLPRYMTWRLAQSK